MVRELVSESQELVESGRSVPLNSWAIHRHWSLRFSQLKHSDSYIIFPVHSYLEVTLNCE